MPDRLRDHNERKPKQREVGIGAHKVVTFYPNEVAKCLAIDVIDYRQLRTFFKLIRDPTCDPTQPGAASSIGRNWSRFTVTDMASLLVAIDRCGGKEALEPGHRLSHHMLRELSHACRALYHLGFERPLLQVQLVRIGTRIAADCDGLFLDPLTGQTIIGDLLEDLDRYFDETLLTDDSLARLLRDEIDRYRR